jgi:hypothetical protein
MDTKVLHDIYGEPLPLNLITELESTQLTRLQVPLSVLARMN